MVGSWSLGSSWRRAGAGRLLEEADAVTHLRVLDQSPGGVEALLASGAHVVTGLCNIIHTYIRTQSIK